MAKRGKAKKKTARKGASPTVTVRFANEGAMAKKKGGKRKSPRRSNPSKKKGSRGRRRRNPSTFWERAGKLAAGAAVAVGTGVLVTYAQSKIMPGQAITLYGLPALAFLAGVGIARTMPTLGVGMALGSFAGFATPLTSKLLAATTPTTPTTTTTAAIRAVHALRSARGRYTNAVDMRAVDYAHAS